MRLGGRGSPTDPKVYSAAQQVLFPPQMSGDKGISAFPESDNLFKWVGTIYGAAGTVSVGSG